MEVGEIRGHALRLSAEGLALKVDTPWGHGELQTGLIGRFNAENLLACLGVLLASNISLDDALAVLEKTRPVAGRMQRLGGGVQPTVIVDYAHTPDALDKTLSALSDLTAGRLICVFGCGGGRDKGKRPLMGEAASRLADLAIVTSDNPRSEEPADIVADILAGMPPGQTVELDRSSAIRAAIAGAGAGDVVLIAGKGHEDYQEIHGVRHPFSDVAEAERVLKEVGHALA
jgi:UDP-N-acetylmuramoyl-L-alanyl-D-glutamate--2,6-diaminopimelate ligase